MKDCDYSNHGWALFERALASRVDILKAKRNPSTLLLGHQEWRHFKALQRQFEARLQRLEQFDRLLGFDVVRVNKASHYEAESTALIDSGGNQG